MPNLKNSPLVQVGTIKGRLLTGEVIKRMDDYRRTKLSFEMIFGSILRKRMQKYALKAHWQVSASSMLSSLQKKNLPLKSCTPITAKMKWKRM